MAKHATYSASKISRIIRCPGSVDFIKYLKSKSIIPEETQTTYTSEGTMLHGQIELKINDQPFDQELDAEQEGLIEDCYNFLQELRAKHELTWLQTERRVSLKGYGIDNAEGTADIIAGHKRSSLHILDWKFGGGVPVYVEENEQLMDYLLGAAENPEKLCEYEELWIHLAQPRFDYFESYQCNVNELMGLINAIKNAIGSHDIIAGEKQCFWCDGKPYCKEYNQMVDSACTTVFQVHTKMMQNEHSFKDTVKVLELEPFLKKVFKMAKDELNVLSGQRLAELKLKRVAGRSNRSFVGEDQVVDYLVENYKDIDDIYEEPKLLSPAQLEKKIKGLKKDKEFQKLIVKPLGKPTIVSIDDGRPEHQDDAASTFAHLKG